MGLEKTSHIVYGAARQKWGPLSKTHQEFQENDNGELKPRVQWGHPGFTPMIQPVETWGDKFYKEKRCGRREG